jgi:hypothetical protein
VTEEELAAVVAAIRASMQQPQEPPPPAISKWKRAARLEAILRQVQDDYSELRMTHVR